MSGAHRAALLGVLLIPTVAAVAGLNPPLQGPAEIAEQLIAARTAAPPSTP